MDNYFTDCPAVMNDGRMFTDYRSSQVREEIFRQKHCVITENEARTLRIENGEQIMDDEWEYLKQNKSCYANVNTCYHNNPKTATSTIENNAELLAYNGVIPMPPSPPTKNCADYRLTETAGSRNSRRACLKNRTENLYDTSRRTKRCKRSRRQVPDSLYMYEYDY
jgi:hypothetical protein